MADNVNELPSKIRFLQLPNTTFGFICACWGSFKSGPYDARERGIRQCLGIANTYFTDMGELNLEDAEKAIRKLVDQVAAGTLREQEDFSKRLKNIAFVNRAIKKRSS